MARPHPRDFLNTAEELHALVIGLAEILAPFFTFRHRWTREQSAALVKEWHYYSLGRILGIFAWLGIAALIREIFF